MTNLKVTDKELEALRIALAIGRLNTQKLIEDPNYLSNLRKLVNSKHRIIRLQKKLGFDNEWDGNTFMPKNEEDYYDISF